MPRDPSSSRRRQRRLQAAQSVLEDGGEGHDFGHRGNGFDLVDRTGMQARSETDDPSSQLFAPRWRRLLRAVAQRLSQRCCLDESISEVAASPAVDKLRATFTHRDAVGGGTEEDVAQCLARFLEVMELSDSDVGFTLLSAYQSLQAQDLPLSSQTWRPLLFTAVLVAMCTVCESSKESQLAATKIHRHVAHWWPRDKAEVAHTVFKNRQSFKVLSRKEMAKLYFELRDTGLRKDISDEGDSNASVMAVFLADIAGLPPDQGSTNSRTLGLKDCMRTKSRQRRVARSGATPEEDSLNFSDSMGFSLSEGADGVAASTSGGSRASKKEIVSL